MIKERTIKERFSNDTERSFDLRQGSTYGKQSFSTSNARVKDFYFNQRFAPKSYEAKAFAGAKGAWFGDFKFSTKDANSKGKYVIPNASKQADTKTMPVADARESRKAMPVSEFEKGRRPFLGKESEKVHKVLKEEPVGWTGDLKPMTIDDVRELLNKNK